MGCAGDAGMARLDIEPAAEPIQLLQLRRGPRLPERVKSARPWAALSRANSLVPCIAAASAITSSSDGPSKSPTMAP